MMPPPKYSLPEIERRWLVDLQKAGPLDGLDYRDIEDHYITGSRLRLRKMMVREGEPVYKLCKKYGASSPGHQHITNIYLTADEYALLSRLPGSRLFKRRYAIA